MKHGSVYIRVEKLRNENLTSDKFIDLDVSNQTTKENKEIKALIGMLARLPWGRRDTLILMKGKHGGVYVKYVSLIVSYHWIKVFITA